MLPPVRIRVLSSRVTLSMRTVGGSWLKAAPGNRNSAASSRPQARAIMRARSSLAPLAMTPLMAGRERVCGRRDGCTSGALSGSGQRRIRLPGGHKQQGEPWAVLQGNARQTGGDHCRPPDQHEGGQQPGRAFQPGSGGYLAGPAQPTERKPHSWARLGSARLGSARLGSALNYTKPFKPTVKRPNSE